MCLRNEWDLMILVRLDGGSLKGEGDKERVEEEEATAVAVDWEEMSERFRFCFGVGLGWVEMGGRAAADTEGAIKDGT